MNVTEEMLRKALHETAGLNHNIGEGLQRAICQSADAHARRAKAIMGYLRANPLQFTECPICPHWMEVHNDDGTCGCGAHG